MDAVVGLVAAVVVGVVMIGAAIKIVRNLAA